ncbi:MAG TPA: A/G-specific adenine glycosylase [Caulobacteraceae bacterium]
MDTTAVRAALLDWYDRCARDLAWRVGPVERAAGVRPDPYRVWLSEVMLQQTTTGHATRYFLDFTQRWPTVQALAAAEDAEVMGAWAGLGYYARARNLLACARAVAGERGGVFPDGEAGLRALPGLGAYTAAAVAAIAFDRAANVVDGNVERVMARLFAVETPLPAARRELAGLAARFVTDERPGDWAQALMDHGATVCRPKSPLCDRCPVAFACAALATGAPETYPRKTAKVERPRRHGVAYVAGGERVAVVLRPPKGLLGGMNGLPTSEWRAEPWSDAEALAAAPHSAEWRDAGAVEHAFTHFALTLRVFASDQAPAGAALSDGSGLPTVFRKALERARG